jgi:hypothetical protein
VRVAVPNVSVQGGDLYRTSASERFQAIGSVVAGQSFTMPPRSIVTVFLSIRVLYSLPSSSSRDDRDVQKRCRSRRR